MAADGWRDYEKSGTPGARTLHSNLHLSATRCYIPRAIGNCGIGSYAKAFWQIPERQTPGDTGLIEQPMDGVLRVSLTVHHDLCAIALLSSLSEYWWILLTSAGRIKFCLVA